MANCVFQWNVGQTSEPVRDQIVEFGMQNILCTPRISAMDRWSGVSRKQTSFRKVKILFGRKKCVPVWDLALEWSKKIDSN